MPCRFRYLQILTHSVSVRTSLAPPYHSAGMASASVPAAPRQGLEFVGRNVKLLVDATSELRKFGLDHVAHLPELVLVGDQSAGKSSLMSALTEVSLPRDQGICTKCPANIKTSPADTWSCKISLQQYYRYTNPGPRGVDSKHVTRNNPFPPWQEQELEVKDFLTIIDKSGLEDGIKWAQIALLNHDVDHTLFIPGVGSRGRGSFQRERESAEAKFSPNVIAVEISGPDLPALSFYDLPGIFQIAAHPEDQYLAKVIENLAIKYIDRPNALIIWTLAMKTDPSNSYTGKVIQNRNATSRCVGVLTNPDHVAARHIEYEKILEGQAHIIKHGYFVTRQPGPESALTGPDYHALARQEEVEFFDSDTLWTNEWRQFRSRCGTTAIQQFLSRELAKQIIDSLPKIRGQIRTRAQKVDEQLLDCPALPDSDIRNIVMRNLAEFSNDVRCVMNGDSVGTTNNFQSEWKDLSNKFRDLILHIKPMITVAHPSDDLLPTEFVSLVSDDDDDNGSMAASPVNRKHSTSFPTSHAKRQKQDSTPSPSLRGNDIFSTPHSDHSVKRENRPIAKPTPQRNTKLNNPFIRTPFEPFADAGRGFADLARIRNVISSHTRAGLGTLVDIKVYDQLCLESVRPWDGPLDVFVDETILRVREQLGDLLHKHLRKYEQTELYRAAQISVKEFVDTLEAEQRASTKDLYDLETYKFFTVNNESIAQMEVKELASLQAGRKDVRAKAFVKRQMRVDPKKRFPADMPKEERDRVMKKRVAEVKDDQLSGETMNNELQVATTVRAYYITAGLRFADSVCLNLNGKLFRNIRDRITFHLEEKLGIAGMDGKYPKALPSKIVPNQY